MPKTQYLAATDKFTTWCKYALKFWAVRAKDSRGGYAEHLNMDGIPDLNHVRRVRVQSRQAYVFAHAGYLGWMQDSKTASDHAWDFVTGQGSSGGNFIEASERGCAHLVTGEGNMVDDMRDTYAQAFLILAGAWRYRAFNDIPSLEKATSTLWFLNSFVRDDANGGWFEALPRASNQQRRQAPHMHLFEAFITLYEATSNRRYGVLADEIYMLFKNHFFDLKTGVLLEYFNQDWSRSVDTGPIVPGHMMEWVWLLCKYSRISGQDVSSYVTPLYDKAIEYGYNERLGLLYDQVNFDGSQHTPTSRTWPQTELIKASVIRAANERSDRMYKAATQAIEALFKYYLSVPAQGGWADKISEDGHIISNMMPTSTFYHLFCAAAEAEQLASRIRK